MTTLAEATDEATIQKYFAWRMSGWSTIRPGCSSCTTSTRGPSARRSKGFVSPQSWFVDLTLVDLQ